MSLTAALLHNQPITLPKGRRRTHRIDDTPIRRAAKHATPRRERFNTSADNCEAVYTAILAGHNTISALYDATGLGKTTLWRAVGQLETWPTGQRIARADGRPAIFIPCHA